MTTKTALAIIALISLFALSGCGFTPVYGDYANGGKNSIVSAALDNIYIDSIPDRTGQKLRNIMMDRFYQTGRKNLVDAKYRLHVGGVGESVYGLGIAKDATATRSQIKLTTAFTLTAVGDPEGKPLFARTVTAVSSFDTLASEYTTLVTEEDARDQTIQDLSDQIATLLELYFSDPSKFPTPEQLLQEAEKNKDTKDKLARDPRADIGQDLKGY